MVSDIVLLKPLPDVIRNSIEAYVGCVAGASLRDEYLEAIRIAGFEDIGIVDEEVFPSEFILNDPTAQVVVESAGIKSEMARDIAKSIISVKVSAIKP